MAPRVVVTGLGIVAPGGDGCEALWHSVAAGTHRIRPWQRARHEALSSCLAGQLPAPWDARIAGATTVDPCALVATAAAREALLSASLDGTMVARERIGIVLGTSAAGLTSRSQYEHTPRGDAARRHELLGLSHPAVQTAYVAAALDIHGPRFTISTACTSSTMAIGHARDLLVAGIADVFLAGGVDVIVDELVAGFLAMGAMSDGPCAPFSETIGMTLGEGAAFLTLERLEHAQRRGVRTWCELRGWGASADGYHATAPEPTGSGMARSIDAALGHAGLVPADIGFFHAHGTGTDANDAAEWRAIKKAFGPHAERLPVSSSKSYFGHALGAAGGIESVVTVMAMREAVIPPTLSHTRPRAFSPTDPVAQHKPRPCVYGHAVKHNAAFGGANATLVLSQIGASEHHDEAPPSDVVIVGVGVLAGHGHEDLDHALDSDQTLRDTHLRTPIRDRAVRIPQQSVSLSLRGIDVRGMDRLARYLTAATVRALVDASLRVQGALRGRIGLAVGTNFLAWDSADEFWDALRARGYTGASAPAFSRLVLNAPAGAASRALSLRGPLTVVADGAGSSLRAAILARSMLMERDDLDVMAVAGAFELGRGMIEELEFRQSRGTMPVPGESAACVLLARAATAERLGLRTYARILAVGSSSPARPDLAIRAMTSHAIDAVYTASSLPADVLAALPPCPLVYAPSDRLGAGDAMDAVALAAACQALRRERAHGAIDVAVRRALVVAAHEDVGVTALLLVSCLRDTAQIKQGVSQSQ